MRMSGKNWGLLFFLSILWGGAFYFSAIALTELPPFTIVGLRTGIGAFALVLVLRVSGGSVLIPRKFFVAFAVMGILNNLVPFSLFIWAQTVIPSGLASILNAFTPIFSILIAHFALSDEKFEPGKFAGTVLGVLGVAVLLGGSFFSEGSVETIGVLACLGATASFGFANVFGHRFKNLDLSAIQVALGQLTATTLMVLPVILLNDTPWMLPLPSISVIASVAALAVFSTALAYVVFFHLLATSGAVNVALVTFLIPLSAIVLGIVFLGEKLEARHYQGMCLLAVGLLAIDGRVIKFFKTSLTDKLR